MDARPIHNSQTLRELTGHAVPASPCQPQKEVLDDGNEEGAMDSVKALAATAAIRQMVEALPAEFQPKTTRQDAQKELEIIRDNSPQSCKGKIVSVSGWLDFLFSPEKDRKFSANDPARRKQIREIVLGILARIEAEIAQGLPDGET
jgi:hypothetical protein